MKWIGEHIWEFTSRFRGDIRLGKKVYDGSDSAGTSNQVLTSTGTGVVWKSLSTMKDLTDKTYTHIQTILSDEWEVEHNLNKHPSVTCVLYNASIDPADYYEFTPDVEYTGLNTLTVHLSAADRGYAYCN